MSIYRFPIRSRRLLAVVVVVALVALMAIVFAGQAAGPARAAGPGAGMSLQIKSACTDTSQLTTVQAGVPFVVCVVSDPAPSVAIAGFDSEVIFPSELKWTPRASCEAEVQVGRQDTLDLAICNAKSTFLGGVGHTVFSEFADLAEPLTVPAGSTTILVELDFTCNVAGSYKLTLTAAPDSAEGAAYADLQGHKLNVKTVLQDYDGDTVANDVADTATFECVGTVGGIAEFPDVAGTPLETTASSDGILGLIVGVATAMLLAISGGAWYVGRRRLG